MPYDAIQGQNFASLIEISRSILKNYECNIYTFLPEREHSLVLYKPEHSDTNYNYNDSTIKDLIRHFKSSIN